jgi:ADP-ribosylglycohydrolase
MARSTQNAHERLTRAIHSLPGLSCGDTFGERFFLHPEVAQSLIAQRAVPSPPWRYTDDTVMAIAVAETLEEFDEIQEASLAAKFWNALRCGPSKRVRRRHVHLAS